MSVATPRWPETVTIGLGRQDDALNEFIRKLGQ